MKLDELLRGLRACIVNGDDEDAQENIFDLLRGLRCKDTPDVELTKVGLGLKELWKREQPTVAIQDESMGTAPIDEAQAAGRAVRQGLHTPGPSSCSGSEMVNYKLDDELMAILVRSCSLTHSVDTWLFGSVEMARSFAQAEHGISEADWDSYMVAADPNGTLKLNGEPHSYVGWRHEMDEHESFHIQLTRKIIEF